MSFCFVFIFILFPAISLTQINFLKNDLCPCKLTFLSQFIRCNFTPRLLNQLCNLAVFLGSGHRYRGQVALVTLTWSQHELSGLVCIVCVCVCLFWWPLPISPKPSVAVRDYFLELIWVTSSEWCLGLLWAFQSTCVFVFQDCLVIQFCPSVSSCSLNSTFLCITKPSLSRLCLIPGLLIDPLDWSPSGTSAMFVHVRTRRQWPTYGKYSMVCLLYVH